jgi:hypothetical protein
MMPMRWGLMLARLNQHLLTFHHVFQVNIAMFAIVQVIKGLAIAGATAIVDGVDGIAVVDQILNQCRIANPTLAPWTTVNPHQGWHWVIFAGLQGR